MQSSGDLLGLISMSQGHNAEYPGQVSRLCVKAHQHVEVKGIWGPPWGCVPREQATTFDDELITYLGCTRCAQT